MKKKIAILLCVFMCLSVFGSLSIVAADAEVSYQVGEGTPNPMSLEQAFKSANARQDGQTITITLLRDVEYNGNVLNYGQLAYNGKGDLIVDGAGHKWTTTNNTLPKFVMASAKTLTIKDLTVENTADAISDVVSVIDQTSGTVNVNNCNFNTSCILFWADMNKGTINLNVDGGTYVTSANTNGALVYTKEISSTSQTYESGQEPTSNVSIKNATLIATAVSDDFHLIYAGQRNSGGSDNITFENTDIYAPNYIKLLFGRSKSDIAFNGCNICLPSTPNTDGQVRLDYGGINPTFSRTMVLGGRNTGFWGGSDDLWGSSQNAAKAFAGDGTGVVADLPALLAMAAVRLDSDGIKFETSVSEAYGRTCQKAALALKSESNTAEAATLSYGTLVILQSELDKIGISKENLKDGGDADASNDGCYHITKKYLEINNIGYLDIVADKGIQMTGNDVTYHAALDGITEDYYDAGIATIAYVKASVGGEDFYFYSSFDPNKNTHCIKDVAQQAIESGNYSGADLEQLQKYAGVTSTEGN